MIHNKLQKQQTDKLTLSDTKRLGIVFHDSVLNSQEIYLQFISMCIFGQTKHIKVSQKPVLKYM